ncbi:MAG: hypothetical protein ACRDOL_37980, partial [Streptosporangiaceae bacterium]
PVHRRAAEMFEEATRALANPGITDEAELALHGGWTFHQLRHAALTLEAEDGTNTPTLLAISRTPPSARWSATPGSASTPATSPSATPPPAAAPAASP